jgi:hypothetical protein
MALPGRCRVYLLIEISALEIEHTPVVSQGVRIWPEQKRV